MGGDWYRFGFQVRKYAGICFTYTVTSVIVESLFSHMAYNQSGSRGSLSDDTTAAVIVCKELDPIAADATTPLAPPHYDEDAALKDHVLTWKCA